jgi:DNA-binding MarR family transcriptional regulator
VKDLPVGLRFEALASLKMKEVVPDADLAAMGVIFNLLRAANRVIQDVEASVHRPLGVSWAGFRILFTVLTTGPCEAWQVARLAGVTRATVSSVLDTLERSGLVERRRESTDKRLVTVALTERGTVVVLEAVRCHHAREREWVAALDPAERETLAALLRLLVLHQLAPAAGCGGDTPDAPFPPPPLTEDEPV